MMDEEVVLELQEAKDMRINHLKKCRDYYEKTPVEYNGVLFDFDETAFNRINAAIIALDGGGSIGWTTADNQVVTMTAVDLRGVIAAAAARSNDLHIRYRELKERVQAAETEAEVHNIMWKE